VLLLSFRLVVFDLTKVKKHASCRQRFGRTQPSSVAGLVRIPTFFGYLITSQMIRSLR
jgi:hypothetical protein